MGKVRVYELAKELGLKDSKQLLTILRNMGYNVKTASNSLSQDIVKKVKETVKPHLESSEKGGSSEKPAVRVKAKPKAKPISKPEGSKPGVKVRKVRVAKPASATTPTKVKKVEPEKPKAKVQPARETKPDAASTPTSIPRVNIKKVGSIHPPMKAKAKAKIKKTSSSPIAKKASSSPLKKMSSKPVASDKVKKKEKIKKTPLTPAIPRARVRIVKPAPKAVPTGDATGGIQVRSVKTQGGEKVVIPSRGSSGHKGEMTPSQIQHLRDKVRAVKDTDRGRRKSKTSDKNRELPPDQAIAAAYRQKRTQPTIISPPPPGGLNKGGKRDRNFKKDDNAGDRRKTSGKRGRTSRSRDIQVENKAPRRPLISRNITKRKKTKKQRAQEKAEATPIELKIEIPEIISVGDLAERMEVTASDVIKHLIKKGQMVTINQGLEYSDAAEIAKEYGFIVDEAADEMPDLELLEDKDEGEQLGRPAVVTVLGHVDHGKTSLLDTIRSTNVSAGEAGGITQRIGAYHVEHHDRTITFIDTPGHEAFTHMRARGAEITDIAILIVAADDGVMPQTIEAINHAKAAKVPIIVAVNKMDKPDANPDNVLQQLSTHGLIVEDWGGDVPCVRISALHGDGIDELLEMITLITDLQELTASQSCPAEGIIIESRLDKQLGSLATVLVKKGNLKVGETVVVGDTWGRVRSLLDENGQRVETAGPSIPVEVMGLSNVPNAGDKLIVVDDERMARQVAAGRSHQSRSERIRVDKPTSLEAMFAGMADAEIKEFRILIKTDAQGSLEAVTQSINKLSTDEVKVTIVHGAVGGITESDVMLASASSAMIVGFNVRPNAAVRKLAEQENIEIRLYKVIYHMIEEIEQGMAGMLAPDIKEVELGSVEVREVFKISRVGNVAGCYVTEGKITRSASIRLVRDGILIYEGKLDSLKRFKDDAREVSEGYECGITIANYNDIREGDVIEAYTEEEVARESL